MLAIDHNFLFYDKTTLENIKPTPEKPLILNILGSAVSCQSDWKYIFTYEDFYNYLKNIAIPDNIQAEIDNAVHYLFIGFDFDKFYNTLILFLLKLNNKEKLDKTFRYAIEKKNTPENIKNMLAKQFNITFIEKDYNEFLNSIIAEANKKNIYVDLELFFVNKQLFLLQNLADEITDAKSMANLKEAETKLKQIIKKSA